QSTIFPYTTLFRSLVRISIQRAEKKCVEPSYKHIGQSKEPKGLWNSHQIIVKIRRQHNSDHIQYCNGNLFEENPLAGKGLQQNKTEQDQTAECCSCKGNEFDLKEI